MPVFDDVPVLCGHRGSGRGAGENTLGSFMRAWEAGLRWGEIDARLDADGDVVCWHDPRLDGRWVSRLRGHGLLRLADALEQLPADFGLDIEIKTSLEDALRPKAHTTAARVAELVQGTRRRVVLTSFDPSALPVVRTIAPELPVGLLTWRRFPLRKAIPAAVHLGAAVVAPHVDSFGLSGDRAPGEMVAAAHEAGLQVLAWNVGTEHADELAAAGVDCLCVDDVASWRARVGPGGVLQAPRARRRTPW